MIEADAIAGIVAANLVSLRKSRQLTLEQLATASGVSKGMVVQIEQARSNASIATLVRLANALGVTVSRLIEPSDASPARKVRLKDAITLWQGKAGGSGRLVAGVDTPALLEFWEWTLNPGEAHESIAHPAGTREMLLVQVGILSLSAGVWTERVEAGELLAFAADAPHRYGNESADVLHFLMVVLEPPGQGAGRARG